MAITRVWKGGGSNQAPDAQDLTLAGAEFDSSSPARTTQPDDEDTT